MSRLRFQLTSDQLELLIAFEQCDGLANLAAKMAKDPSVISRHLQRLAEVAPVLVKLGGRWQLSPLGRQVCTRASAIAGELHELLKGSDFPPAQESPFERAGLIIINAQRGLLDPALGGRSTPHAESNIERLLTTFRALGKRIFHVRHVSRSPSSPFHVSTPGVELLPKLSPLPGEPLLDKESASAFMNSMLAKELEAAGLESLVLTGFTANECIDATARHACEAGFRGYIIGDATASFELRGPEGRLYDAERVHRLTLANLHAFVATVLGTDEVLARLHNKNNPGRN